MLTSLRLTPVEILMAVQDQVPVLELPQSFDAEKLSLYDLVLQSIADDNCSELDDHPKIALRL